MAHMALLKPFQWRMVNSHVRRISFARVLHAVRFSTAFEDAIPNAEAEIPNANSESKSVAGQIQYTKLFDAYGRPFIVEDHICALMAYGCWTTNLQNYFRSLVPEFNHSIVYNVLHAAAKPEHTLRFYRWVEQSGLFQHNRETSLKMIEILCGVSKFYDARCILVDLPKKGVEWDEDMFVILIDSYGKAGIVEDAVKLFNKMKKLGVDRTLKSYDVLFKAILRKGEYMMAETYFNKMISEGIEPTRHTYNVLFWGFFLSRRSPLAELFYEDMIRRGIPPDSVTYDTMIKGFCHCGRMQDAEHLFVKMKEKNIVPNVINYTTVLQAYVSTDRIGNTLRLLEEMECSGIKPNAVTYSTLLPELCFFGQSVQARNILNEMAKKYIAPTDNSIFMKLLSCHVDAGDLNAAMDVLKAMFRLGIPTEAGHYGILIENFCKVNEYDRAVKLLDKLVEKEIILRPQTTLWIKPSAYNPMIHYLCNNGKTAKAETFLRQLMKKGVEDQEAFNNLIHGYAKEGSFDSAFEILKTMGRSGASGYKLLINSYLGMEPADAKAAMDSMIEDGHTPDSSLFRLVMQSLFDDGRIQTASLVMKTMMEKKEGVKDNIDLVAKILEGLLMRGHVEEALGRVDLLMQNGCTPNFDDLLSVLCEKGKMLAAIWLLYFGLNRDCHIESLSYEKVLDSLLAAGNTQNAYLLLCKIVDKGAVTNWSGRYDLIKSLNQEGNTDQADILTRMIKEQSKFKESKRRKKGKTVSSTAT